VRELPHGLRLSRGPENEERLHLADRHVKLDDFVRKPGALLTDEGADRSLDVATESIRGFSHPSLV